MSKNSTFLIKKTQSFQAPDLALPLLIMKVQGNRKTLNLILNLTVFAILVTACGNGKQTPDINYAAMGYPSNTNTSGNTINTNTNGAPQYGQCSGAVNVQNVNPNDLAHSYSACRTSQGSVKITPSTNTFNDSVCVFYSVNGNPLYNRSQGTFVYQCVNLTSAGQTLNTQGISFNSAFIARSADSYALTQCFMISASNPGISIQDCAQSYNIAYAIGGF